MAAHETARRLSGGEWAVGFDLHVEIQDVRTRACNEQPAILPRTKCTLATAVQDALSVLCSM